jgi:hypothetical protein
MEKKSATMSKRSKELVSYAEARRRGVASVAARRARIVLEARVAPTTATVLPGPFSVPGEQDEPDDETATAWRDPEEPC